MGRWERAASEKVANDGVDAGAASAVSEAPSDDEPASIAAMSGVIVQTSADANALDAGVTDVLPASASARSGGPTRTLIGSSLAVVIVALVAALLFLGRGTGPTNLTGGTSSGGTTGGLTGSGTAPTGVTPSGSQPVPTATGSTVATLNGGLPMSGSTALTITKGGCPGYPAGLSSLTTTTVVAGQISIAFGGYSGLMTGQLASDGTFAVTNTDGSVAVHGTLMPTAIVGTMTVTKNGCPETLQFSIALAGGGGGSGGGVTATPPATNPPFTAVIISFNEISFSEPSLDFCHKPFLVKFEFAIIGIGPDTPVVVKLTGRGTPSGPQTFLATGGVKFGASYSVTPGAGDWTDTIESIGGQTPPSSGSHVLGPIQC
jgi:hypothetical protein